MMTIGLTGGIGSGKTTVANFFKELGIPIYIADIEAKKIMNSSLEVREELIALFGEEAFIGGALNRKFIASKVFSNNDLLQKLNHIVHPQVAKHFKTWAKHQNSPYIIYEAAILFENNAQDNCDYTILVTAPKDIKLKRLQKRDDSSVEEIESRMSKQWNDSQKIKLANFVITNTDLADTKVQVYQLHSKLLGLGKA
ncbi:dephospho-CoA kinase [Mesonia ostreae]|uniref:Dephospho-CoA kinase n=1 Tax=Mesonia ostreae TaxID=861110 RepID=A0ABU2KLP2_9FLAO|nr:dephospho-CoA kinase [Mesonia ostreae]MDT0295583.1 dephospho-CoA kinase [Mesonia ostreae]